MIVAALATVLPVPTLSGCAGLLGGDDAPPGARDAASDVATDAGSTDATDAGVDVGFDGDFGSDADCGPPPDAGLFECCGTTPCRGQCHADGTCWCHDVPGGCWTNAYCCPFIQHVCLGYCQ